MSSFTLKKIPEMRKITKALAFFFLVLFSHTLTGWARWIWSPEVGKFVNSEGQAQDTAEELYDYALQFYKDKDLDEAVEQLKTLVKNYPNSRVAPDAQYRIATIYEEQEDFYKAFEACKHLIESYPQNRHFDEVVERLYRIGNLFLSGQKAKLWGLEILPSLPRAVEIFNFIIKHAPFSEFGDKSQFQLGLSYKKWGHYAEAVQAFQTLIDQYPQSPLAADARFQLAETSFQRSTTEFRDQRALDEASKEVDQFLEKFPSAETSEKAERLRQAIDEKNAEKNYHVAEYYEKQSYVDSALIYYTDAAQRYPNTHWGAKAAEKIRSLKEPAAYHTTQEKEVSSEIQILEAKLKVTDPKDAVERERLERKIQLLNKREKNLNKEKKESIDRLKDDIKRRGNEIKEKFKNLEKKKKAMKNNKSEDFQNAMERWEASLRDEQQALAKEKETLVGWQQDLGVPDKTLIPFMPEKKTELESIRHIEAKKLYKVSAERKALLEEKELLYKQRGEVLSMMQQVTGRREISSEDEWLERFETEDQEIQAHQEILKETREKIKKLEKQFDQTRELYEEKSGRKGWHTLYEFPTRVVAGSTSAVVKSVDQSFDFLNPFDGSRKNLSELNVQELLEMEMHLKEQVASQQSLIETLSEAFDSELALQEQKRLMKRLEKTEDQEFDAMNLRKEIKAQEKVIRASYQEIEDLDKQKDQLLKRLDELMKQHEDARSTLVKTGTAAAAPFVKTGKMVKAFFVGLPNKGVELTEAAKDLPQESTESDEARKLRDEIELKSLLIEAKSREIVQHKKQLEILRAKASLSGGFKFRSVIVDVPYEFIGEAIDNAKHIIPKKDRDAMLINRLDEETKKLEGLKTELKSVQEAVHGKEIPAPSIPSAEGVNPDLNQESPSPEPVSKTDLKELELLKTEISSITQTLETQQGIYKREKEILQSKAHIFKKQKKENKKQLQTLRKGEKLRAGNLEKLEKELNGIEKQLQELIKKETELESRESAILQKRISQIDQMIPKILSKAMSQNLISEREKMESRLSQLTLRKDFLSKEVKRFQLAEGAFNP